MRMFVTITGAVARCAVALAMLLIVSPFHLSAQLAPEATLAQLRVAEGLEVTLFAAEPDLVNPTSMTTGAANTQIAPDTVRRTADSSGSDANVEVDLQTAIDTLVIRHYDVKNWTEKLPLRLQ